MRLTWVLPEDLLAHQLVQSRAEGIDVTDATARWTAAGGSVEPTMLGTSDRQALRPLARELLAELDAATPAQAEVVAPDLEPLPAATDLAGRVLGGWTGRAAGCLLGKPVEGMPPEQIREVLTASGQWPPRDYITAAGVPGGVRWHSSSGVSLRENLDGMPEDDDLNYAILALRLLEHHGRSLRTEHVAEAWLWELPVGRTFTAERVAYRNLLDGVPVDRAAVVANPFREWIGAQIRTDVYGWTNPGDRTAAARLAVVDARLSHTRAGVHGAVWVAAMSAAALGLDDATAVVEAGLAAIPPDGEVAKAVRFGLGLAGSELDEALAALHSAYQGMHWVHAVNNSALTAYALAAAGGDFETGIGIATMGGWDTDSVGATVGAVLGALHGVPDKWARPLDNRIATSLPGLNGVAIDELAERTLTVAGR
jgi:ADP-ribosylglycohydrolase